MKPTIEMSEQRAALMALFKSAVAIGETIAELGTVPAGHLYATVCGVMTLQHFESLIGHLVDAGVVHHSRSGLLTWTGERPSDA